MCGIAGFVSLSDFDREKRISAMLDTIRHRGPDGSGILADHDIAIGMTRLAIIDLETGDQPIYNEDETIAVVCNGEIYNSPELRKSLEARGHRFRTRSDVEVIVHLYEEYGESCPEYLDGMFAFAVIDRKERRLLVVRDRLGIKPLFIATSPHAVSFCSEIKGLLADPALSRQLNLEAIADFLTYTYIPTPKSIYKAVHKLPPGSGAIIESDGVMRTYKYWSPPTDLGNVKSYSDAVDDIDQQLANAVQSHLLSDVPVGVFLSGGVDSSLIAALASQRRDRPVVSFTVGFEDSGASFLDERVYARELAVQYGFDHREVTVKPDLSAVIDDISRAFDEPFADDSVIPSYYLCQESAKHAKVMLSGLGGDELFAGYRRHLGLAYGETFARVPGVLQKYLLVPLINRLPESRESSHTVDHLKRFMRAAGQNSSARYQDSVASVTDEQLRRVLGRELRDRIADYSVKSLITTRMNGQPDLINAALRTDLETYLVDDVLTLTDRLSMWHSLEVRVPFLDHNFVELAMRLPQDFKIKNSRQKRILKAVAGRYLPQAILSHKKQGFESPMARWLRGPLKPVVNELLSRSTIHDGGFFDPDVVVELTEAHMERRSQNSKILFSLLMFQNWLSHSEASL